MANKIFTHKELNDLIDFYVKDAKEELDNRDISMETYIDRCAFLMEMKKDLKQREFGVELEF